MTEHRTFYIALQYKNGASHKDVTAAKIAGAEDRAGDRSVQRARSGGGTVDAPSGPTYYRFDCVS
jgi:hypothetical protein